MDVSACFNPCAGGADITVVSGSGRIHYRNITKRCRAHGKAPEWPRLISDETESRRPNATNVEESPMRPRTLTLLAAAMTLAVAADAMAFDAPESKLFTTRDFS